MEDAQTSAFFHVFLFYFIHALITSLKSETRKGPVTYMTGPFLW
mgnify:FL=1